MQLKKMLRSFLILSLICIAFNLKGQQEYIVKSDTKIRTGPGIKYKSLGAIRKGERVIVVDTSKASWYKIAYHSKTGFLSVKLLDRSVFEAIAVEQEAKGQDEKENEKEDIKSSTSTPYVAVGVIIIILILVVVGSKNKKEASGKKSPIPLKQPAPIINTIVPQTPVVLKDQKKGYEKNKPVTVVSNVIENKVEVITEKAITVVEKKQKELQISLIVQSLTSRTVQPVENDKAEFQLGIAEISPSQFKKEEVAIIAKEENKDVMPVINRVVSMTIGEFRAKMKALIDLMSDSKTKDIIAKFHRLDLSYIDLARTRYELLAYKVKDDQQNYFAFMNLNGEIDWAKKQPDGDGGLFIGQPLIRTDYYNNILQFTEDSLLKSGHNLSKKDDSVIDITGENYILPESPVISFSYGETQQTNYDFIAPYWGIGTKYKSKLKLTDDEVKVLDALIDTNNKFNSIEFIAIELIRLFFDVLNHLNDEFSRMGSSMTDQINSIAEIELTQRYKLWKNSVSYKSQLSGFANSINQVIYKIGENSLRDYFGVGRKTDLKYYISTEEALSEFNERFHKSIEKYIPNHLREMKICDESTEMQFNDYTKARWKNKLEFVKTNSEKSGYSDFYEQIVSLGRQNKNNPSVENIFFDASKFISKFDKIAALKLYSYYVFYDLQSATFDNKQLAKTIQKSLFNNEQQLREFELIINTLIENKKIDDAIESVTHIYSPKRKKIQLDSSKIKEVQDKHSDTVELLNEYLKEEEEALENQLNLNSKNEVELIINYVKRNESLSVYKESQRLSEIQEEVLNLFSKRGFTLSVSEFGTFVKSKGAFKNSLIESINEIYFELLDDVLIEEDDDAIFLTEDYYNKILN